MFDPEKVDRFEGIDVEGVNGSKGWGCGFRLDGETEMVQASDYDSLLSLYRELNGNSADMNRPWPEFKKDLRYEGKSKTDAS